MKITEDILRRRVMRSVVMVWFVMGLLMMAPTHSSASTFTSCYGGCFVLCVIIPNNTAVNCAFKCLKDCIVPSSTLTPLAHSTHATHANSNIFHFCKFGCASSLCSNFSTKHNPNSEKVEGCVDSCSGVCTNN